jgi:hypothetical protein
VIHHIATVLCDYLIRAEDGRFTLAGIFQNIQTHRIPALKDPMAVYLQFSCEEEAPYEVLLRAPDGEERILGSGSSGRPATMGEQQQWSTSFAAVIQVVFTQTGTWAVILRSNGVDVHTHKFGVLPPPDGDKDSEV